MYAIRSYYEREIAATPAFQVNGVFQEDRYRSILSYNQVSPAEYEASKKEEITIRKLEGLFSASARVSDSEAHDLFDLTFRKIRLLVVTSDPAKVRGIVITSYSIHYTKLYEKRSSRTIEPTKPHSSENTAKAKSVCCSGRNRSDPWVPWRYPFPSNPPDPTAILDWMTW